MTTLLATACIGLLTSLACTPLVRALAHRWQLTDRPDDHRKLHREPIALGGGIAVFIGLAVAVCVAAFLPTTLGAAVAAQAGDFGPLLAAGLLIVAIGLVDDRFGLRGRHKLLGQVCVAGILVASGLVIRRTDLFGVHLELGLLSVPLTMFWLVGAMNSLNLIDGVDGLASTVGLILSLAIAAMALLLGRGPETVVAVAFAGSLLGFLRFNFPQAKIFLGDAGSMLIGLVVGALAIRASLKGPATMAMAAPLAVWAIPILDSTAAIIRRKLTGRSIYTTDRGHLHHCLLAVFDGNLKVVGAVALGCAVTCAGALVSVYLKSDTLALLGVVAVAAILVVSRVFGYVELLLVGNRLKSLGRSLLDPVVSKRAGHTRQEAVRLQGTRHWDLLWTSLTEFAGKLNLSRIRLDVNLPAAQEGYHASWQRTMRCDPQELWTTEIPLFSNNRVIGRLSAAGEVEGASACELVERLMDLLAPFEARLAELAVVGAQASHPAATPFQPELPFVTVSSDSPVAG